MAFEVPKLNYAFDALEPHLDAATMQVHYEKHFHGYCAKLNAAIEKGVSSGYELIGDDISDFDAEELLMYCNLLPDSIAEAVINNGGGFVNHSIFFSTLSPQGGGEPSGDLAEAIVDSFGSFDAFKDEFSKAATSHFGSGWVWLVLNFEGDLEIVSTDNQDNPLMSGLEPLLGIDLWEHSYYLKFQNKRPDYVAAWWNVVDWSAVAKRFEGEE